MNPRRCPTSAQRRERRWTTALIALVASATILGCPAPLGGWDLAELSADEPRLSELPEHRLGDLVPYPAPFDAGYELVSCRWDTDGPIPVRLRLTGERLRWARHAVESLSAGTPGIDLAIEALPSPSRSSSGDIDVIDVIEMGLVESLGDDAPIGVGDTLVACDVASREDPAFGTLGGAEIRMRSSVLDQIDEVVAISAEDWTGALMHELGHALGFQGHLRAGHSILIRDESELRRAGRAALAGELWRDETLAALYRIAPGRRLGWRSSTAESRRWLAAIEAAIGPQRSGPRARVGDRHAQLEWRSEEGAVLRLHLPFWSRQLRAGEELVALASASTRSALRPNDNREPPEEPP